MRQQNNIKQSEIIDLEVTQCMFSSTEKTGFKQYAHAHTYTEVWRRIAGRMDVVVNLSYLPKKGVKPSLRKKTR